MNNSDTAQSEAAQRQTQPKPAPQQQPKPSQQSQPSQQPQQQQPKPSQRPQRQHRAVDLGREDQLVTWGEWFNRTSMAMSKIFDEEQRKHFRFRVTLVDRRVYSIRQALSHVARGRCSAEPSRWHLHGEVCDVITGYQLLGNDAMGNITMLAVTPDQIASVECVLMKEPEEREPFGFASFARLRDEQPTLQEVDEFSRVEGDETTEPPAMEPADEQ